MYRKAEIGRFDGDIKVVAFEDGDSIQVLLDKAGFTVCEGEMIRDGEGNKVSPSDTAVEGEDYFIVRNFKQG